MDPSLVGNTSKVSWKDLHEEILRLEEAHETRGEKMAERIDRLRAETLDRMERMRAESAERAAAERQILEELRDSMGDMHTSVVMLPCEDHKQKLTAIAANVDCMRAQLVNWKWMWSWLNRKTIAGLIGAGLGLLGWDKLGDAVKSWGK